METLNVSTAAGSTLETYTQQQIGRVALKIVAPAVHSIFELRARIAEDAGRDLLTEIETASLDSNRRGYALEDKFDRALMNLVGETLNFMVVVCRTGVPVMSLNDPRVDLLSSAGREPDLARSMWAPGAEELERMIIRLRRTPGAESVDRLAALLGTESDALNRRAEATLSPAAQAVLRLMAIVFGEAVKTVRGSVA